MKKNIMWIIIILFSVNVFAQNESVTTLENKLTILKKELAKAKEKIDIIEDSIKIVISEINAERIELNKSKGFICETVTITLSNMRDEPNIDGALIVVIPHKSKIKVINNEGNSYWKVMYNDYIGYVNEVSIAKTPEMKEVISVYDENLKKENERYKIENKNRVQNDLEKRFGKENASRISRHMIWIGMTSDMAAASIGSPIKINRTTGSWGIHEQWVYHSRYLYFENGKLTSWQD
ncbi:MAG: hypothetical protein A2X19_08035 [Bacteroidetes bacterium GWE2_39_28]|nr:MAG: hypothetical protein A2X19_08035 [Bacteroidetes bacterium GWE2_39_28]OFY13230.1 MAG: hypothetical protein A2X16_04870 [Bacteroidetes bacterium GWF2_39_10]OFZ09898.1 MAG: hypothetical protein A2465_03075 [Bacteroidetes bacterium RIFOXYC2_FULL_39_11]HCT94321.1 hypothetical protein [Rikenellaceae bacterium]